MKLDGHTVNWYRLIRIKNGEITSTRSLDIRKIKGGSQVSGHSVYVRLFSKIPDIAQANCNHAGSIHQNSSRYQ